MSDPTFEKILTRFEDIVRPAHTALVIWDVQNALVDRIFNQEDFLARTPVLLAAARKAGVPVIYSKITPLAPAYESPSRTYMMMKRFGVDDPAKLPRFMEPGTPGAEIHQAVAPAAGEAVLPKHTASMFVGTHFEAMMRNHGVRTILFAGISTEMGISSSARDAVNRGFYTVVVRDCVSSPDREMHEAALQILSRIAIVAPSDQVMDVWA